MRVILAPLLDMMFTMLFLNHCHSRIWLVLICQKRGHNLVINCGALFKICNSLPASVKFRLSSASSAIALADGQQAKTHGLGHVVVRLGTKDFQIHVIVAEVEDKGILGMDFLSQVDSQVDSHFDIVKKQVSINGEVFDCSDFTEPAP